MIIAKTFVAKTPFKRFHTTRYLYIVNNNEISCKNCLKPIEHNNYCFLCSDLNKIYHENCFVDDHIKNTTYIVGNIRHHSDWLCLLKLVSQKAYDNAEKLLENPEDIKIIELNI
jgi:hypothetical protein